MGRPAIRKTGAMSNAQRQKRYRINFKKTHPSPKTVVKRNRRAERERDLAERTVAASTVLGTNLYGVIYADPPWRWEPRSRESGMDRAADNHYPTMPTDAIKALQVPAAPDSVLFMWATVPMLAQAIEVVTAWGFEYKSALFWDKVRIATGYWGRDQVELLLIATRGNVPAPAPGEQPAQLVSVNRTEHSAKPESFAADIARLYPTTPKLELFARRRRDGWDSWGNEV